MPKLPILVATIIAVSAANARADTHTWPKTSNALEFAGYLGVGSSARGGGTTVFGGGQLGFCILCMYGSKTLTIGDSHSIYYGYPLGGAIAEGVLIRYGVNDDIDVGARVLYELYDDGRGGQKGGPVGQLEARWQRSSASFTFALGGDSYVEGTVRYMLDGMYGLKLYAVRTDTTSVRVAFGGFIF